MGLLDPLKNTVFGIVRKPKSTAPTATYYIALLFISAAIYYLFPKLYYLSAIISPQKSYVAQGNSLSIMSYFSAHAPIIVAVLIFIFYIPSVLLNGMFVSIGKQMISNSKISIKKALKISKSKYKEMMLAGIIFTALFLLVAAVFSAAAYIVVSFLSGIFVDLFLVPLLIVAVASLFLCAMYFFMVNAVIIFEDKDPIGGIKRSFYIASKNRLKIASQLAALFLALGFFALFSGAISSIPFGWAVYIIISTMASSILGILPVYMYWEFSGNKKI